MDNTPFTIQPLTGLLNAAPVVIGEVFTGGLEEHARSGKFPGMVTKELLSKLIFFVFELNGLEQPAGLFRLPTLLLGLEDDLRLRESRKRLHALPDELVLGRAVSNHNLGWRNVAHHVDPWGHLLEFPAAMLTERSLSHPEGREVDLAHGGRGTASRRMKTKRGEGETKFELQRQSSPSCERTEKERKGAKMVESRSRLAGAKKMGLDMGGPDWSGRVRCKARESVHQKSTPALPYLRALDSQRSLSTFGPRNSHLRLLQTAQASSRHAWLTQCHNVCLLMPHPNRSSCSPGLRDPPKQAADELLLSRPSMFRSKPSHSHASLRTFTTRRPRPTIASIADVFVGSLVLAGFCQEHSPRGRGLSTMSPSTSGQRLRRYRIKSVAGRNELPAGRRLSPVQPSRSRSSLSAASARIADDPCDQNYTKTAVKEKAGDHSVNPLSTLKDDGDEESREQLGEQQVDSIRPSHWDTGLEQKEHTQASQTSGAEGESSQSSTQDGEPSLSYDEKNYIATSELYRRILGDKGNWKKAVDLLLAMPQGKRNTTEGRDEIERPSVAKFVEVLAGDLTPTTQHLFSLYRNIPAPGVAKLSKRSRGYLLRRLAKPPSRRWADARRYLAVVDDMVLAGLPMSLAFWTSAISFAGRGTGSGKVMKRDLVRAIGLWQQMEHLAGIPADEVVFNTLFDVAVKAGQYVVAGRIEQEMTRRGMDFSRFGMVSKLFFHGLRKDVDGISQTFDKFVKSGEVVDTVVLNCLCASYLRAGWQGFAEQIYARMLDAQAASRKNSSSLPDEASPSDPVLSSEFLLYRRRNMRFGRFLNKGRSLRRNLPEYHRALQQSLPMTPDTRTFYIFLRHFSHQTGQLNEFMSVLRDMESIYAVPPRAIVYMLLFEGFGLHGRRKKAWSAERLRLTWHAYLRALRESKTRLDSLNKGTKSPSMVWENPLGSDSNVDAEFDIPESDPGGFYMSLPSANTQDTPSPLETLESHAEEKESDDPSDIEQWDPGSFTNPKEATNETTSDNDPDHTYLEHLQKRVPNGVFVGRKMIIVILRAFGACCGPKEVLEAWLQLEKLWNPDHRKAHDVFAVKEELNRQMSVDPTHDVR